MTTGRNCRWKVLAIAGLATMLVACEPTMEDVLVEHRPGAERVFAQLKTLESAVFAIPPLTEDRISLDGARVRLRSGDSNALFLPDANLREPERTSDSGDAGTHSSKVAGCGEALRGEFRGSPVGARGFLSDCARAEYVFVLRRVYAPVEGETYDPLTWRGEVLLFRLADGAALGGFRVGTDTRGATTVLVDGAGNQVAGSARTDDPRAKIFAAIDEGLRTHVPGVLDDA